MAGEPFYITTLKDRFPIPNLWDGAVHKDYSSA